MDAPNSRPSETLISRYLGLDALSQILSQKSPSGSRSMGQRPIQARISSQAQIAMKEIKHTATQKEIMLRLAAKLKDPENYKELQPTGVKDMD